MNYFVPLQNFSERVMKKHSLQLYLMLCAIVLSCVGCERGKSFIGADDAAEVSEQADSLSVDSMDFEEEEDEGLHLEGRAMEVFGDFVFAFTHDKRFQSERISFPLEVVNLDGSSRRIESGKEFRDEFRLPGNDYYVMLLSNRRQMDVFQNDSALKRVSLQCIDLAEESSMDYVFLRDEGRWHLVKRHHRHFSDETDDFLRFYHRFMSDSVYQQSCLASQLSLSMENPDDEGSDMQGTIDPSQWPVFRPEMPGEHFVNIDFGQDLADKGRVMLVQCGISNGMMDILSFRRSGERWELVSIEN